MGRVVTFIDSCGYRREISRNAPKWAHDFSTYARAIELIQPDGYAAWDYPDDRLKTMDYLRRLLQIIPDNGSLWPVFSIRWTWNDNQLAIELGLLVRFKLVSYQFQERKVTFRHEVEARIPGR